jgi:hypothetical protein
VRAFPRRHDRRRSFLAQLEQLEPRWTMSGLIHEADLNYLGAFKTPTNVWGANSFEYGGTAIAYNPVNNSLFMVGHDQSQKIAELSIPTLKTGALSNLNTGSMLQPFVDVAARIPNNTLTDVNGFKVGGLMVVGNQLVGSLYEY